MTSPPQFTWQPPSQLAEYLRRIEAELINPRRAIVRRWFGNYYQEVAVVRISPKGDISTNSEAHAPTKEESSSIKAIFETIPIPKTITVKNIDSLLPLLNNNQHFIFYDQQTNEIIMAQERRDNPNGTKSYIPWVMLNTGDWVNMEPDHGLPFFKPQYKHPGARIMIHEGAKAAQAATSIKTNKQTSHPWYEELIKYEHWGMIGGALAPHRTNYHELKNAVPSMVVYVCDRDWQGESALQKVSYAWGGPLVGVKFSDFFPQGWDMADHMPASLFTPKGRYIGPQLQSLMEPATWATEEITGSRGRPRLIITSHFSNEWVHCIRPQAFVHKNWPNRIFSTGEFDNLVRPYSNTDQTSRILMQDGASKKAKLQYDPSSPSGHYSTNDGGQAINTHVPSSIKAEQGDATLWEEFLDKFVGDDTDRNELVRWCATLVQRPGTRMLYGLLLISETQGIGKGTLGEKILAPLLGHNNVSYPSEGEVVESRFNYWLSHKRLAIVHEIYAGQSSKAYNKLKSTITDKYITVSQKFVADYEIENWIHILACSNSRRALKLSMDDRRWFVPRLNELKRTSAFWETFNGWLKFEGGLGIIKWWLEEWLRANVPVIQGVDAPYSTLKRELVEEGYSPGQQLVVQKLQALKDQANGTGVFTLDTELVRMIKNELYHGQHNDHLERPRTVRATAIDQGWFVGKIKSKVKSWGEHNFNCHVVATNPELADRTPGELARDGLAPVFVSQQL